MFNWLEKNPFFFVIAVICMITFAGVIELLPGFTQASRPTVGTKPYSVLELAGKHIYIQNSCNACHSQLVRPFKSETDRYGRYSISGEYAYDRPFLWGSKRTGPDLMRVGNYRTTDWHEIHMLDPDLVVPGSIMPAYPFMFEKSADIDTAWAEAYTVKTVFGVPYDMKDMPTLNTLDEAKKLALDEAKQIATKMKDKRVHAMLKDGEVPQIVALIAYLNSLK